MSAKRATTPPSPSNGRPTLSDGGFRATAGWSARAAAVVIVNQQRRIAVSRSRLAQTAAQALTAAGHAGGELEVLLVDDPGIRRLNARYRGARRATDVLAFPLALPDGPTQLLGQVTISADTAARQARRLRVPVALELDLLVVHGILHLAGYDDRDPVEARLMHQRARDILEEAGRSVPPRLWKGLLD